MGIPCRHNMVYFTHFNSVYRRSNQSLFNQSLRAINFFVFCLVAISTREMNRNCFFQIYIIQHGSNEITL